MKKNEQNIFSAAFGRLISNIDKKLKEKAKLSSGSCCCGPDSAPKGKKGQNSSCCK